VAVALAIWWCQGHVSRGQVGGMSPDKAEHGYRYLLKYLRVQVPLPQVL